MAYLILDGNNQNSDSGDEQFYEFDAQDRETLEKIENLLARKKECPPEARDKLNYLFDTVVKNQQDNLK